MLFTFIFKLQLKLPMLADKTASPAFRAVIIAETTLSFSSASKASQYRMSEEETVHLTFLKVMFSGIRVASTIIDSFSDISTSVRMSDCTVRTMDSASTSATSTWHTASKPEQVAVMSALPEDKALT